MSPREMHDFEKALMNDPFLADALEGYSASNHAVATEHITAIESALTNNKLKAKVVQLSVQKSSWWKVAAVILAVVAAGALTYSVIDSRLSGKKKAAVTVNAFRPAIPEKDSIGPADKPLAQLVLPNRHLRYKQNKVAPLIEPDKNETPPFASLNEATERENAKDEPNKAASSLMASSAAVQTIARYDLASSKFIRLPQPDAQNEFKGRIVDRSGEFI